jgi:hypothetical protein
MGRSLAGSTWRAALAPAAAGLLGRLALIAWTTPLSLAHDEQRFWDLATTRMAGTAFLPPLYPLLLAGLRAIVGDGLTGVRVAGACLSVASIVLAHRLAERHLGRGSGTPAAWVAALMPSLIYFDGRLRGESLVILLLLGFTDLWTMQGAGRGARLGAGALIALVGLTRPEFLILPVVLVAIAWRRGAGAEAMRRAAHILPGLILILLPWMVRNQRVVGLVLPAISANGGYNFWKSFNPMTDGSQVPVVDYSLWDGVPEARMDGLGYREGWRYIREHPVRSLLLAPARLGHLLGPERDWLSDLHRGHFPRRLPVADLGFALVQNAAWVLLLAAGLFALLGPSRSPVKDAVVALLLTCALVHLAFFGDDRFHVPLVPFLGIALPEAWDGSLRRRGTVRALALFLAALAGFWCYVLMRDLPRLPALWTA